MHSHRVFVCIQMLSEATSSSRFSRSNAIMRVGYDVVDIKSADDIKSAEVLVFPGVGSFGPAADFLAKDGFADALKA